MDNRLKIFFKFEFSGYDLSQVNMYINKLFENIGSLLYEGTEENEKCNFTIIGVQSALGEKLEFQQVSIVLSYLPLVLVMMLLCTYAKKV